VNVNHYLVIAGSIASLVVIFGGEAAAAVHRWYAEEVASDLADEAGYLFDWRRR
jgi:hypothetical protein